MVADGAAVSDRFWKMSGSGNDFIFTDARHDSTLYAKWSDSAFISALCAPHTGVGADGVGILQAVDGADFRLSYFNRDGSLGELCGNASLCAMRLAIELGAADPTAVTFATGAGSIRGRIRDGLPEIDLQAPTGLADSVDIALMPGENRLGFVDSGVPHLVILTDDLDAISIGERGPELRHHESLRAGANVNWVAKDAGGRWRMRTYERGVEAETLACGTGAVATALLLAAWGKAPSDGTTVGTRSGRDLKVRLSHRNGGIIPTLAGEGRIVFEGVLRQL